MTDYPLDEIDDDDIENGDLYEAVKKENHAAGLPVISPADESDPDAEWLILEYPDGTKKRYHISELGNL